MDSFFHRHFCLTRNVLCASMCLLQRHSVNTERDVYCIRCCLFQTVMNSWPHTRLYHVAELTLRFDSDSEMSATRVSLASWQCPAKSCSLSLRPGDDVSLAPQLIPPLSDTRVLAFPRLASPLSLHSGTRLEWEPSSKYLLQEPLFKRMSCDSIFL